MFSKILINSIFTIFWMTVFVYASSQFLVTPRSRTIKDGESTTFHCQSSMEEDHDYSWTLNGNNIKSNHRVLQFGSSLKIIRAIKNLDSGEYVCIAKSYLTGAREASPSAFLTILTHSNINELDALLNRGKRGDIYPVVSISENMFTQLPCNFLNQPKTKNLADITVKWAKDAKPFREIKISRNKIDSEDIKHSTSGSNIDGSILTDDSRVYVSRQNGSLIFSSTTASDEGSYVCYILSTENESIKMNHTKLQIIETLKFTPQPTSKNLELGSIGKVHCRAQGTPNPHIKWLKENGESFPESIEDRNGTLIFRNTTVDHNGNYTCIATNSQGEIAATVMITIVVAPKFLIFSQGPINATEMSETMLHCQATGDPEPTIQWDKDLVYLSNQTEQNRFQILDNGTLLIQKVYLEDEGLYGCTIGNSAGLKREEIQLLVKPSEIFNLDDPTDGFVITRAVLITMSVAFAYIIFVIALMIWCRYKRAKGRARLTIMSKNTEETCDDNNMDKEIDPCLIEKSEKISPKSNSKYDHNDTKSSIANSIASKSNKTRVLNTNYELVLKSELTLLYQLGRGYFGDVLVMKLNHDSEKTNSRTNLTDTDEIKLEKTKHEITVLVKTLKKTKEENLRNEFKRQLDLFGNLEHDNISKFYGLCQDESFHAMVLEWTDWGDFKQFLLATVNSSEKASGETSKPPSLKMAQMLTAAHQISKGLDAIYRARFIHKDIATRNCIISSNFVVKISYPALSKDKYQLEYYKHLNELIPLRWLAPECLQDEDYSIKSDIYSFGVLVWEIFTNAANLPNESLSNEEFLNSLKQQNLERTLGDNTPADLKEILLTCWSSNPKERPPLSQLITALGNSLNREYSNSKTES